MPGRAVWQDDSSSIEDFSDKMINNAKNKIERPTGNRCRRHGSNCGYLHCRTELPDARQAGNISDFCVYGFQTSYLNAQATGPVCGASTGLRVVSGDSP